MPVRRQSFQFDAADQKVCTAWLRTTLATYGALILLAIAVVTIQATAPAANFAMLMGDAVAAAAP